MSTASQTLPIKATFAILDVTAGRSKLAKAIQQQKRITVTITGSVGVPWGSDDGTSQEFSVDITSIKTRVRPAI